MQHLLWALHITFPYSPSLDESDIFFLVLVPLSPPCHPTRPPSISYPNPPQPKLQLWRRNLRSPAQDRHPLCCELSETTFAQSTQQPALQDQGTDVELQGHGVLAVHCHTASAIPEATRRRKRRDDGRDEGQGDDDGVANGDDNNDDAAAKSSFIAKKKFCNIRHVAKE